MKPLFVFSMPRSGSTMLQRLLMAHDDIASVAEPWILLPLIYAFRKKGVASEYSAYLSSLAVNDFIENLPNKKDDYFSATQKFIEDLYSAQCTKNEKYFLDKTPRYFFIIPEIIRIFPDAKFIFLFRNPIHIYASILATWGDGRFYKMNNHLIDLQQGPDLLANGWNLLKDRALTVRYENLVTNPCKELTSIFNFLDIKQDNSVLETFTKQHTHGRLGDPNADHYSSIQTASMKKAQRVFATPYRKYIIKKYINSLETKTLAILGYEKQKLLDEISAYSASKDHNTATDIIDFGKIFLIRKLHLNLVFRINQTTSENIYLS